MKIKIILTTMFLALGSLFLATNAEAQTQNSLKVCGTPASGCFSSKFYALELDVPKNARKNKVYKSAPVYVVVLSSLSPEEDSEDDCGGYEGERREAENYFPKRKSFYNVVCPDLQLFTYTALEGDLPEGAWLGVYAGLTKAEADKVLAKAKATKQYPNAKIAKIQVEYTHKD